MSSITTASEQASGDPAAARAEWAAGRRARLLKTSAYYLAFIVLGLAASSFGPTLPGVARHVSSTIAQVSYLFVLRSLGYLIGSVTAGRVYDRVKGHPIMAAVVFIMVLTMFLVPVTRLLWVVALILLLLGFAEGLLDVGVNTLIVWVHRDDIGPFMNGLHFFFGLGAFFSPIIIAQAVATTGDIYWAYWALAILMILPALYFTRIPSPTPIVTRTETAQRPALPVLIVLLALFLFMYVGAEVSYGGWVFTYATTLHLGTDAIAALLTSGFWGALTVGRLVGIPLAGRFPPRQILLVDILVVLASLVLVIALPGSFTALWIGTIGAGLGMASIFPVALTIGGRYMTITGRVTSWFFIGSSLGGMTLPWLIGQLFAPVGPRVAMYLIGANMLIDLLLLAGIILYTRRLVEAE